MTFSVEVSKKAQRLIHAIDDWWRVNRPAAPDLFWNELQAALQRLETAPESAPLYRSHGASRRRRRYLVLRGSRECIIYDVHPRKRVVSIVDVWSPRRGGRPAL
jgi:plasmid stabilization system protein ParE